MLALRQLRPWSNTSLPSKLTKRSHKAKITTSKSRQLLTLRYVRQYSNDAESESAEQLSYDPDMTLTDFGMPNVTLDTEKYLEAFSNSEHFQRPSELAWNLWHPPSAVIRPLEWLEVHEKSGARSTPAARTVMHLMATVSTRVGDPRFLKAGARDAFVSVMEHVSSGEIDALEPALDPSVFKYIQGWLKYMKEHGYTMNHTLEKVLAVEASGITVFETKEAAEEDSLRAGPLKDGAHISRFGAGDLTHIAAFVWAKITSREKFEILDSKGSLILSSPSTVFTNYWKFGATGTTPGAVFDVGTAEFREEHADEWQFKLYDINHQVINRAGDILTKEHLFLDSDAPRHKIWQMTRAF